MKQANLKKLHTVWFPLYDILEKAKLWSSKKMSGCQGLGNEWIGRAQRIWGTVGETSLYDTIMVDACHYTRGMNNTKSEPLRWWRVNIGPSVILNTPFCWGMLIMGEGVPMGGQGGYRKSLYLPLNFAVNLKLLQEIKSIKKVNNYIHKYR